MSLSIRIASVSSSAVQAPLPLQRSAILALSTRPQRLETCPSANWSRPLSALAPCLVKRQRTDREANAASSSSTLVAFVRHEDPIFRAFPRIETAPYKHSKCV
jgi:hypothetical protein